MPHSTRIRRHPGLMPVFLSQLPRRPTNRATRGRAERAIAKKGPQPEPRRRKVQPAFDDSREADAEM
eukprot:83511-Pyramimonas_sp.AAC.1